MKKNDSIHYSDDFESIEASFHTETLSLHSKDDQTIELNNIKQPLKKRSNSLYNNYFKSLNLSELKKLITYETNFNNEKDLLKEGKYLRKLIRKFNEETNKYLNNKKINLIKENNFNHKNIDRIVLDQELYNNKTIIKNILKEKETIEKYKNKIENNDYENKIDFSIKNIKNKINQTKEDITLIKEKLNKHIIILKNEKLIDQIFFKKKEIQDKIYLLKNENQKKKKSIQSLEILFNEKNQKIIKREENLKKIINIAEFYNLNRIDSDKKEKIIQLEYEIYKKEKQIKGFSHEILKKDVDLLKINNENLNEKLYKLINNIIIQKIQILSKENNDFIFNENKNFEQLFEKMKKEELEKLDLKIYKKPKKQIIEKSDKIQNNIENLQSNHEIEINKEININNDEEINQIKEINDIIKEKSMEKIENQPENYNKTDIQEENINIIKTNKENLNFIQDKMRNSLEKQLLSPVKDSEIIENNDIIEKNDIKYEKNGIKYEKNEKIEIELNEKINIYSNKFVEKNKNPPILEPKIYNFSRIKQTKLENIETNNKEIPKEKIINKPIFSNHKIDNPTSNKVIEVIENNKEIEKNEEKFEFSRLKMKKKIFKDPEEENKKKEFKNLFDEKINSDEEEIKFESIKKNTKENKFNNDENFDFFSEFNVLN